LTGTYKTLLDEVNLLKAMAPDQTQTLAEAFVAFMAAHPSETVRAEFVSMHARAITGKSLDPLESLIYKATHRQGTKFAHAGDINSCSLC